MATVHIDAATRQHPHVSVGAVIIKNEATHEFTSVFHHIDNNEAEWATLIFALEKCIELNIKQAIIYTDSQIVVDSIEKRFAKDPRFKQYLTSYVNYESKFDLLLVSFITREHNKHADHLAKTELYKYLNK